jgi:hypothetical protein
MPSSLSYLVALLIGLAIGVPLGRFLERRRGATPQGEAAPPSSWDDPAVQHTHKIRKVAVRKRPASKMPTKTAVIRPSAQQLAAASEAVEMPKVRPPRKWW